MEVYIDNVITKSVQASDHVGHLKDTFTILKQHNICLNHEKLHLGLPLENF